MRKLASEPLHPRVVLYFLPSSIFSVKVFKQDSIIICYIFFCHFYSFLHATLLPSWWFHFGSWKRESRMNITVYEMKFNLLVCECANILSDFDLDWTSRVYSVWTNNISGYCLSEDASVMGDLLSQIHLWKQGFLCQPVNFKFLSNGW